MPPKRNMYLYGERFSNITLKWSIAPGQHVAHMSLSSDEHNQEIDYKRFSEPKTSGYGAVSQTELYNTLGDNSSAYKFMELAKMSADDYDSAYMSGNEEMMPFLESVKNFVTASSRSNQQAALNQMKTECAKYRASLDKNRALPVEKRNNMALTNFILDQRSDKLKKYEDFISGTMGNLKIEGRKIKKNRVVREPASSGILGSWKKVDDSLFPHDPSPNDIKQGFGVQDCFMLAPLATLAAQNPDYIKNSMCDNGDGTVTVRFYDKEKNPVFIDVNKTVARTVGNSNLYSQGCLWVQMMEKAYVKFVEKMGPDYAPSYAARKNNLKGFAAINRGISATFLNAFTTETYLDPNVAVTVAALANTDVYDKSANTGIKTKRDDLHPEGGYFKVENDLFDFYKRHINDKHEVFTAGADYAGMQGETVTELRKYGIRPGHAYGMLKVFEQEVGGQLKKFVQLRDPYGTFRAQYDPDGKLVSHSYGLTPGGGDMVSGIINAGTDQMGTFNLEFTDYLKLFPVNPAMPESSRQELRAMGKEKFKEYTEEIDNFVKSQQAKQQEKAQAKPAQAAGTGFDDFEDLSGEDIPGYKPQEKAPVQKAKLSVDDILQRIEDSGLFIEKDEVTMPELLNRYIQTCVKPEIQTQSVYKEYLDAFKKMNDDRATTLQFGGETIETANLMKLPSPVDNKLVKEALSGIKMWIDTEGSAEDDPIDMIKQMVEGALNDASERAIKALDNAELDKAEEKFPVKEAVTEKVEEKKPVEAKPEEKDAIPDEWAVDLSDLGEEQPKVEDKKPAVDAEKDARIQVLVDKMKQPGGYDTIRDQLDQLVGEIKSTDEFFVLNNTKPFRDMRDALYATQMQTAAMDADGYPTVSDFRKLAECMDGLGKLAKTYESEKQKSIEYNKTQKHKEPSVRALHRLSAAMSIKNLCAGKEPIKSWPNKEAEGLGIVVNDIANKAAAMQDGTLKVQPDELAKMEKTMNIVGDYLNKHKDVMEKANVKPEDLTKIGENIGKVKNGEIEQVKKQEAANLVV